METLSGHKRLGKLIRERRKARGWTLDNVSEQVKRLGLRLSPQHLSNIENAYSHPGKEPSTPPDDLLRALSRVLDTPLSDFHAALGRMTTTSAAAALVREKAATFDEFHLTNDQMDALITDLERYAEMRLQLTAEQIREKQGAA